MYGSLAHTGISWPLYALVGIIALIIGMIVKLSDRVRGRR